MKNEKKQFAMCTCHKNFVILHKKQNIQTEQNNSQPNKNKSKISTTTTTTTVQAPEENNSK